MFPIGFLVTAVVSFAGIAQAQGPTLKTDAFDRDPEWDAVNNRIVPEKKLIVTQDFGYSETNIAGGDEGEIGGRVQRSTKPAYYAAELKPVSLEDKLTASGTFAVVGSEGGAGLFFGFFNSNQPGGSGRPIGSLGLDFDFEGSGGRLAVRLITGTNKTAGTFITPYLPGKFRPTPIRNDGTRYRWTLDYDPHAADDRGRFKFTITSDSHTAQDYGTLPPASAEEARVRFPSTKEFTVDLPPGYKKEGATFDRFGLLNMMKSGGTATIYFDNVTFNRATEGFAQEPNWVASGNRTTYEDKEQTGAHDYGFSHSRHAGGEPFKNRKGGGGEVGGSFWRSGARGYYADRVGPLDLTRKLEARGKVSMVTAGPDSDMYIGWFNAATVKAGRIEDRDFVGIHVGGPTRVGHYFIPQLATATASIGKVDEGPIIVPGQAYEWSLVYDPEAAGGRGAITTTLGDKTATLELKPGQKAEGAELDRFGLFTTDTGGQMVKIYLDDLNYSAATK
jgi:hypothetical protein